MIFRPWFLSRLAVLFVGALVVGLMPGQPLAASPPTPAEVGRYRVEGVVTREQRSAISATGVDIEGAQPGPVEIVATADQVQRIRALGFAVWPSAQPPDIPLDVTDYHNYNDLTAEVLAVAARYPQITQLFSIGLSYEGRDLWAMKISDNVQTDEDEPEVLLVGHYHAREHLTVEMMLYLLHMLTDEYDASLPTSQITQLVDADEIYLVFDLNPDGGEYDFLSGVYGYWRKNRQPNANSIFIGTDLNRNHGYQWGNLNGASGYPSADTYFGPAPASAPEVAAMQAFIDSRVVNRAQQISVAISFHVPGWLILWPYAYTYDDLPSDMRADDQLVFAAMGYAMAATNGYRPQQFSDMYIASGEFTDWAYGTHHIFAYTFEMATSFYLPGWEIPIETARNRAAVLYLLSNAGCPYATIGKAAEHCTDGRINPPSYVWLPLLAVDVNLPAAPAASDSS